MQTLAKTFVLLIIATASVWVTPQKVTAQYVSVSFQLFYDELSPYGMWVDYPGYGYVWVPDYGPGFYPYATNGYWVYTEFGWTWVSNYPWGWAPFHYGRWHYTIIYGWIWIPGDVWGPAWVVWRSYGTYYGWAPIPPGVTISMAYSSSYYVPHERWVFVEGRHLGSREMERHYGPRTRNTEMVKKSSLVENKQVDRSRNTTYSSGPRKDEVQRVSGKPVKPVSVRESNKPSQRMGDNELSIYRPKITRNHSEKERPANVEHFKGQHPSAEKGIKNSSRPEEQNKNIPEKQQAPGKRDDQQDRRKEREPQSLPEPIMKKKQEQPNQGYQQEQPYKPLRQQRKPQQPPPNAPVRKEQSPQLNLQNSERKNQLPVQQAPAQPRKEKKRGG